MQQHNQLVNGIIPLRTRLMVRPSAWRVGLTGGTGYRGRMTYGSLPERRAVLAEIL